MNGMVFENYGGYFQLRVASAYDLKRLGELPDARWAVTSAPVVGLQTDEAFLRFLDADGDGRVRSDEVRCAVGWMLSVLGDTSGVDEGCDFLKIEALDVSNLDGRRLRDSACVVLGNLGMENEAGLSLEMVRDVKSIRASAARNGDGVIPPVATDDAEAVAFIDLVMGCVGWECDLGGERGVTRGHVVSFLDESRAYLDWLERGRGAAVLPWGDETADAWRVVEGLHEKILHFFSLCRLARVAPDSACGAGLLFDGGEGLDFSDRVVLDARVASAPLAAPNGEGVLYLDGELNPGWRDRLDALRPLLERGLGGEVLALTEEDWVRFYGVFSGYGAWLAGRQGAEVASVGAERLESILASGVSDRVLAMIDADEAVADEMAGIQELEKLILFQRHLLGFVNSFVNFGSLYDPAASSYFEMGVLVLDGREMTFAPRVLDRSLHKRIAERSSLCILYVEVERPGGGEESFEVVVAVTSGDSIGLYLEKRGVFFTPDGREWDARVVDMVANPVNLWEFFKDPFRRFGQFVFQQVDRFSKTQQGKVESAVGGQGSGALRDVFLAGSIGLAALGSSFAFMTRALSEVALGQVLLVLFGVFVFLIAPPLLIGYIKLRQRDLTTLLEASGWAVNFRVRVRGQLGRLFTHVPRLPKGHRKRRSDMVDRLMVDSGLSRVCWVRVLFWVLAGVVGLFAWLSFFVD